MFETEFLCEPTAEYPQSHASAICETPDGSFIASWFAGTREKALDVAVVYRKKNKDSSVSLHDTISGWDDPRGSHRCPKAHQTRPFRRSVVKIITCLNLVFLLE
nr:hypothetical protein [Candidatus Sigynarchaeota archaeon]